MGPSQGKVMLDGDEAATDTAVSQFRNSSPILMRPVYFPAILSPCYGLPLCNYILIPLAVCVRARASCLFPRFASFSSSLTVRASSGCGFQLLPPSYQFICVLSPLSCCFSRTSVPSRMYASINKEVLFSFNSVKPLSKTQ